MKMEYTFKDGRTLPIKIVTHSDVNDERKLITFMAVMQDDPIYSPEPPAIPVGGLEILDVSAALGAVFRKLETMSGAEFLETPRVGIAHYFERQPIKAD